MRIRDFDEYPFPQNPTPFDVPSTSDVHFNDGYFCSAFAEDWYVVMGIRLHPNMNVMDGFAGLARGGEQRVLRSSRALRPRSLELEVGPLRIEIRNPLREVRIALAESDAGFGFDLTFEAVAPPFMEEPYRFRKYGHLIHDLIRYTQADGSFATGKVSALIGGMRSATIRGASDRAWSHPPLIVGSSGTNPRSIAGASGSGYPSKWTDIPVSSIRMRPKTARRWIVKAASTSRMGPR
jgi:hypothetical protein